jgi:hypothetical protein
MVTLVIASDSRFQKAVARADTRAAVNSAPASTPVRSSGSSCGFGLVTTLPTRKPRCSSLSVGVRAAWYADALNDRRSSTR